MVKIHAPSMPVFHRLSPNKDLKGWKEGEMKDVLIEKYKCGRFAVMGNFVVNLYDASLCRMDFFYQLFSSEKELHDTFTEQLTLPLQTKSKGV